MMQGGASKSSQNEVVKETLERMKTALAEAQTNLERAQRRMANAVNRSRRSEQYNIGDEVVLSTTNLRNYCPHLPAKLRARWVGPFTISRVVSPMAYKVDLPPGWQVHLVFHIDRLKRYVRSEEFLREVKPPPPVLVEDHLEYEVEDLIRHRGHGARQQYFGTLEKGIHLLKLPGSMSETSRTLQIFSRLTCAIVESGPERDVNASEVPVWSKWPQGSIVRGRVW